MHTDQCYHYLSHRLNGICLYVNLQMYRWYEECFFFSEITKAHCVLTDCQ